MEIRFGEKTFKAKIITVLEHVAKNDAAEMYEVLV